MAQTPMSSEEFMIHRILQNLTIKEYIECYLITKNVRPAYLLDDNCKCNGNRSIIKKIFLPNSCKIHSRIKKYFPKIIQTYYPEIGTFVSLQKLTTLINNCDDIGNLLGYPGANEFSKLDRSNIIYNFSITISFKNMPDKYVEYFGSISIICNLCNTDKTIEMNEISDKIVKVLKNSGKGKFILFDYIDEIKVVKIITYPTKYLIKNLISKIQLTEDEKENIKNYIANIYTYEKLYNYDFQYDNEIHIGIIITLLNMHDYNEFEPFYNYFMNDDKHTSLNKESKLINELFCYNLINLLNSSRYLIS
jgi:hypothetical protein